MRADSVAAQRSRVLTSNRSSDHRQLDLWQLHLDVAFGRAHGRVIWQPRIGAWFNDRAYRGESLPGRFRGMNQAEVYRELGCSQRLYHYNGCFQQVEPSSVVRRTSQLDENRVLHIVETPVGALREIQRGAPDTWYLVRDKRWIETPEEMRVATWLLDHSDWRWDQGHFNEVQAEWGRIGAPTMYLPRVNVQDLYINTMGIERAIWAILEWGTVVEDYFRVLHENHLRLIEVINRSPIEIINFGDNLHAATLSPAWYEQYVLPAYHERCQRLHQAGKFVHAHWDGEVRPLLKYACCSGLDGIEALTPKPQGDVTLAEIKEALGNEIHLLDGIPALYFDHTYPEETLIATAQELIRLFAPKLILGISDEICSTGDLERVRLVGDIVDDYNASLATPVAGRA